MILEYIHMYINTVKSLHLANDDWCCYASSITYNVDVIRVKKRRKKKETRREFQRVHRPPFLVRARARSKY